MLNKWGRNDYLSASIFLFLNHAIEKIFCLLKYCCMIEKGCIHNEKFKNAITFIIKWFYKFLWANLGLSDTMYSSISLEKCILSSQKNWLKSVLTFDLFISLEALLLNWWFLLLIIETEMYWVLKYIYKGCYVALK